jgi:plasmid stabilization system protein ParE
MAEIRWTFEAESWLRDIHDYIAANNPDAAIKVIEGIYNKAQTRAGNQQQGHKRTDIWQLPNSLPGGREADFYTYRSSWQADFAS